MRKLLLLLVALVVALLAPNPAPGATHAISAAAAHTIVRHDALPLHQGSYGPRVAGLQWEISGTHSHRPNVFTVAGTFHGKPNGLDGARTGAAIWAYKYRLGYPTKWNSKTHPVAGAYFFALLRGQKQRPVAWVAIAQRRTQIVVPGATKLALKIKAIEISQLGAHEVPDGSNCGPQINRYFARFGIGCGLPWCEVFQQWSFADAGYTPPFANRSFLVTATADWARQHGYLTAKAKLGELVAFLDDGGHIGYVSKVLASGYVTLEGNASNAVKQVYHPWNDRLRVFIALPNVA